TDLLGTAHHGHEEGPRRRQGIVKHGLDAIIGRAEEIVNVVRLPQLEALGVSALEGFLFARRERLADAQMYDQVRSGRGMVRICLQPVIVRRRDRGAEDERQEGECAHGRSYAAASRYLLSR